MQKIKEKEKVKNMKYNESKSFSSGAEYDAFLCYWCERCVHYKLRDGFPEFPENDGCPVLDAVERAQFDLGVFPHKEIIEEQEDNGAIVYYHKCTRFIDKRKEERTCRF